MKCPKCGSRSAVKNTLFKKSFTIRYRQCLNKKCKYKFKTIEQLSMGWDYKSIVKKIKAITDEIKVWDVLSVMVQWFQLTPEKK